jgi:hypothetical protein
VSKPGKAIESVWSLTPPPPPQVDADSEFLCAARNSLDALLDVAEAAKFVIEHRERFTTHKNMPERWLVEALARLAATQKEADR